jgi:hypothetical protein
MNHTLPFEPYLTNIVRANDLYVPSLDHTKFFLYVLESYGARAIEVNTFGGNEWEFETEEQKIFFMLKFG